MDQTSLIVAEAFTAMQLGRFDEAAAACDRELARLADKADPKGVEPFVEVAFALRLARQLGQFGGSDSQRQDLLKFLLAHDRLARALAFLVRDDQEQPKGIYELLDRLREQFGDDLGKWANLTAAVCVVHDVPLIHHVNENKTVAPDVPEIFSYFSTRAKHMFFEPEAVPPELLVHVVNTTTSIPEMRWALARYKGDKRIGRHYFKVPYDMDYFRHGTEKRINLHEYTLPNIRQFGGVCADRAHFVAAIGKAVGIPTCYLTGRGSEMGHAWVGFFQVQGRGAGWNVDYGRFGQYCAVRGNLVDPQTRRELPDDHLAMQAELVGTSVADRHAVVALVDAARCLGRARSGQVSRQLELVEAALKRVCGYTPAWLFVGELTATGKMTHEQKKYWADNVLNMCGRKYPDFALTVLKPMICTVEDADKQNAMWNACFQLFRSRADLAAEIRFAQAQMWDQAGETRKSGQCYADIVNRYVNSGPFAIEALKLTAQKLQDLGRDARVPKVYAAAWAKCKKPRNVSPEAIGWANWVRIGLLYARALESVGQDDRAAAVRAEIESVTGKKTNF